MLVRLRSVDAMFLLNAQAKVATHFFSASVFVVWYSTLLTRERLS